MGSLFGGSTPAPAPYIPPPEPKAVPMVDEAAIARKKKQALAREQQRGGRSSTILGSLGENETLG